MKKVILSIFILVAFINADSNVTSENNESNNTEVEKNIQKAIENEKKFKKEQKFYMGDDYNLTEHQVDPKSLDKIKPIEPEYDFDITDVYAD